MYWYNVFSATVDINWIEVIALSKTHTTLQVVVNALLTRQSPIHDQVYKSLSELDAHFIRYVPWFPYPQLVVPQLYPPSNQYLCAHLNGDTGNWTLYLSCSDTHPTSVINEIQFASWGTQTGECGNFTIGKCHASTSMNVSRKYCLNKHSCKIPVNIDTFNGDPCVGTVKQFDIQVTCSIPYNYSYWNFSLINPLMEDFMAAANPKNESNRTIINFSTIPNWKYQGVQYGSQIIDNPFDGSWSYNKGSKLIDNIGEYYGNLVSYYKNGGFTDKYNNKISSNYKYNIDIWEVLNEPELEHQNTPQSYTDIYDSIVLGIQNIADPEKKMKFMGLALAEHNEWNWYQYFLNHSNHKSVDIPIDYISFHFYASCTNRTDPDSYAQFFPYVDTFIKEVRNITKIRDSLSPNTKLSIDETGVILPGDHNNNSPNPPAIYWNAAGAFFAYLFPKLVIEGIDIVGQSCLLGYPFISESQFPASPGGLSTFFPSVSDLDWNTGIGNARHWVLKLLIDNFKIGDKLVETNVTQTSVFYAQGFISNDVQNTKKILVVNKANANISVSFNDIGNNGGILYIIDETSGNGPAYTYNISNNMFILQPYGVAIFYPH